MAKLTEKYTRQVEYERTLRVTCDWCDSEVPELDDSVPENFDTREFKLEFTTGTNGIYGGGCTGWCVEDLCDKCANRLRNLLRSSGIKTTDINQDW